MTRTVLAEREFVATMRDPNDPEMMRRNAIHTTDGAAQYGFQGALVGGATVYGWTVPAILDAFGDEWLDRGWAYVRFRRPVYPDTNLRVQITRDDDAPATLEVRGGDEVCLAGELGLGDALWLRELRAVPLRPAEPPLQERPALTLEQAPNGRDLRTLGFEVSVDDARAFGREQHVQDERFTGERPLVHPSVFARQMITLLNHSYDYGHPSIHVSSHIQHLARVEAGQPLVLTGRFVDAYERGGHHYAVIEGSLWGEDNRELVRLRHTNIFRVAKRE